MTQHSPEKDSQPSNESTIQNLSHPDEIKEDLGNSGSNSQELTESKLSSSMQEQLREIKDKISNAREVPVILDSKNEYDVVKILYFTNMHLQSEIYSLRSENVRLSGMINIMQDEINRLKNVISPSLMFWDRKEAEERKSHLYKMKTILRKRLHMLEERQALEGKSISPEVLFDLEDIRRQIIEIETELKIITHDLDHHEYE